MEKIIMSDRVKNIVQNVRSSLGHLAGGAGSVSQNLAGRLPRFRGRIIALSLLAIGGYAIYTHPPMQSVGRGEIGMRVNQLTGGTSEVRDGAVLVIPRIA